MICGLPKHGVALLVALGILTGEALSISQPVLAQTNQCSVQQIENNIEELLANSALVDPLAACGSDALPILLRYLDQSFTKDSADGEYQRLLIITTLGQMGSRASSSTRDLAKFIGWSKTSKDLDKAIFYTLWQINGDPTRTLFEILSDTREDRSERDSALFNLQHFARDKSNLIPGGVNPTSLVKTLNDAIVTIAENRNDDLAFRIQAFEFLGTKEFSSDVLREIKNSIDSTLLKVIQDQTGKPEERLDAVSKLENLDHDKAVSHAQIIAPVLTQIIVETSNIAETRRDALGKLDSYDPTLAQKIAETPGDDLAFRIEAFKFLGTKEFGPDVLKEIQNSIAGTLLKIIQDQTKKPEERLDAVSKLEDLDHDKAVSHAQIIAPVLAQVIVEASNTVETRRDALRKLSSYDPTLAQKIIPGGVDPTSSERTLNDTLVTIAENLDNDLAFRTEAFKFLETKRLKPSVMKEIQNSIAGTLVKVIQDQTKKPKERLDAVSELEDLDHDRAVSHAQIIAPVLTQIILKASNTVNTRYYALDMLSSYDPALAQKIKRKVSLPPRLGGGGGAPASSVRVATVTRLKAAPSVVCRYPVVRTVFAWKCR